MLASNLLLRKIYHPSMALWSKEISSKREFSRVPKSISCFLQKKGFPVKAPSGLLFLEASSNGLEPAKFSLPGCSAYHLFV